MVSTPVVKKSLRTNPMYSAVPAIHANHNNNCGMKKSDMVALFMGDCSTTSGSCVRSHLLGPSDTYSTTSSQQSFLFHPLSDSSSLTSSSYSQWVLPPYTKVDSRHYANVPGYKQPVS